MKILKPNNFRELTLASVWLVVQVGPLRSGKGQWRNCTHQKDIFLPPPLCLVLPKTKVHLIIKVNVVFLPLTLTWSFSSLAFPWTEWFTKRAVPKKISLGNKSIQSYTLLSNLSLLMWKSRPPNRALKQASSTTLIMALNTLRPATWAPDLIFLLATTVMRWDLMHRR